MYVLVLWKEDGHVLRSAVDFEFDSQTREKWQKGHDGDSWEKKV